MATHPTNRALALGVALTLVLAVVPAVPLPLPAFAFPPLSRQPVWVPPQLLRPD